jgi:hypothetical protein
VREALGCLLEGSDQVQSLEHEGLGDGYGLQGLSWYVCLLRILLVAFTSPDSLFSVGHDRGPIEALPEHFTDEGAWGRMVPAGSSMYVSKYMPPFLEHDAPLHDARGALLVKHPIDEHKGLCLARESPSFNCVFG